MRLLLSRKYAAELCCICTRRYKILIELTVILFTPEVYLVVCWISSGASIGFLMSLELPYI